MKKSEIFSSEELGVRSEEFCSFLHSKGAGTSVPPNATEVASPIKAMVGNAYRHYSFTSRVGCATAHQKSCNDLSKRSRNMAVRRYAIAYPARVNVPYQLEKAA